MYYTFLCLREINFWALILRSYHYYKAFFVYLFYSHILFINRMSWIDINDSDFTRLLNYFLSEENKKYDYDILGDYLSCHNIQILFLFIVLSCSCYEITNFNQRSNKPIVFDIFSNTFIKHSFTKNNLRGINLYHVLFLLLAVFWLPYVAWSWLQLFLSK